MLDRLGAFLYRRRRAVLWSSLAVVLAAGVFGGPVFGLLDSGDDFDDPKAEAVLASRDVPACDGRERVARPRRARAARSAGRLRGGAGQARAGRERRCATQGIARRGPLRARRRPRARLGGRARHLRRRDVQDRRRRSDPAVQPRLERVPGVQSAAANWRTRRSATRSGGPRAGRGMAFPLLFLLSLFVFRASWRRCCHCWSARHDLAVPSSRCGSSTGGRPISIFALDLVTGLGLGLAIDYSLFMVSRYREELERVGPAAGVARDDEHRGADGAVLSFTVAAALAALLVFPQRFLYSMGLGGAVVRGRRRAGRRSGC